jgi:ferredoxin
VTQRSRHASLDLHRPIVPVLDTSVGFEFECHNFSRIPFHVLHFTFQHPISTFCFDVLTLHAHKNASAMLFVSAKVSHLGRLPQGKWEQDRRVSNMVKQMDAEGFGNCTNIGACEIVCPKNVSVDFIGRMNRDYGFALLKAQFSH